MRKALFALSLATAFAAGTIVPAVAQTAGQRATVSATDAAKHRPAKRHKAARRMDSRQIACTVYGCNPVPRNCQPVTGYNFWGEPTGFDAIACR